MKPTTLHLVRGGTALALGGAMFAALVPAVHAQPANEARVQQMEAELQKRFSAADANRDGLVTKEEARAGMPRVFKHFDAIDTARSGSLSMARIAAYAREQAASRKSGG